MGVMDEAVEDGIGDASAAEELVPVADGELGSDHGCPGAVALLDGLEQILLFPVGQAARPKSSIKMTEILREALQQPIVDAFGAGLDEEVQERRQAQVLDGEAAAAGVLAEGLRDKALAGSGGPGDEDRLMGGDPAVLREFQELLLELVPFLETTGKWNPLLLKAKISPGLWSRHDETIPPEPLTGFQG